MFLVLLGLFSFCSALVMGDAAASSVAQIADITLKGLQANWTASVTSTSSTSSITSTTSTTPKPSELPSDTDAIRGFLEKIEEERWAQARDALDSGPQLDFCIVNSWVAFNYLTQALLEIDSSLQDCKELVHPSGKKQRICAADIFGVLQSFFSTGGYVSGLVSQCGRFANQDAQCASSIVAWLGSINELFQGVVSIAQTCGTLDLNIQAKLPESRRLSRDDAGESLGMAAINGSKDLGRRLGTGHTKHVGPTGLNGAWCYIDVASAIAYLTQAGVNMGAAGENCKDQSTGELRRACSADLNGFFSSISDVVSYVGGAASVCAKTTNRAGLCAGDVGTIGNALFGLGAASSAFEDACSKEQDASAASRHLSEVVADAGGVIAGSSVPPPIVSGMMLVGVSPESARQIFV